MDFIVITDTNDKKIILNINNIVSLEVSHPREDSTMTIIETSVYGTRYYVNGDITKEFTKLITAKNGTISSVK